MSFLTIVSGEKPSNIKTNKYEYRIIDENRLKMNISKGYGYELETSLVISSNSDGFQIVLLKRNI